MVDYSEKRIQDPSFLKEAQRENDHFLERKRSTGKERGRIRGGACPGSDDFLRKGEKKKKGEGKAPAEGGREKTGRTGRFLGKNHHLRQSGK